jgi:putative transcriptional regulator
MDITDEHDSPLRAARKAAGLEQGSLSENTGVSQATISRIENGASPTTSVALRLARALNTTVEALFGHLVTADTLDRTPSPTLDRTGTEG